MLVHGLVSQRAVRTSSIDKELKGGSKAPHAYEGPVSTRSKRRFVDNATSGLTLPLQLSSVASLLRSATQEPDS